MHIYASQGVIFLIYLVFEKPKQIGVHWNKHKKNFSILAFCLYNIDLGKKFPK